MLGGCHAMVVVVLRSAGFMYLRSMRGMVHVLDAYFLSDVGLPRVRNGDRTDGMVGKPTF